MDAYDAIMKAADWIEAHPNDFSFCSVQIPKMGCGTPGCALGWIGCFAGYEASPYGYNRAAIELLMLTPEPLRLLSTGDARPEYAFYNRMDELQVGWQWNAEKCARGMRKYAEEYHAPAKPVQVPDWNAMASKRTVGNDVVSQELAHG